MNKFTVFSLTELKNEGKKVARLKGNRDLNEKAIKSKMKSLEEFGQLVPAIVVDASVALNQNLEVIDFVTGNDVTEDNAGQYIVLLDANHRYKAYLNLKEGGDFNKEFYFTYQLTDEVKVDRALAEINIATLPWKGSDFVKGAVMMIDEELPLLNYLQELTSEGFSLGTASKWVTFRNVVSKTILVNAIGGKIDETLRNTKTIERTKRLIKAASVSFSAKTLQNRYLIDWIVARYDEAGDEDKADIINQICDFLEKISRKDADKIENAKGKKGETTKEDVVNKMLNDLWNNRDAA